ncbi:hypothetical protein B0O99DRAFT_55465 [Bisporella sp. PMI_857]|nr:hypothetical protein B0O99DRAFT_55465 [Bisporella sp. PMI_857]
MTIQNSMKSKRRTDSSKLTLDPLAGFTPNPTLAQEPRLSSSLCPCPCPSPPSSSGSQRSRSPSPTLKLLRDTIFKSGRERENTLRQSPKLSGENPPDASGETRKERKRMLSRLRKNIKSCIWKSTGHHCKNNQSSESCPYLAMNLPFHLALGGL